MKRILFALAPAVLLAAAAPAQDATPPQESDVLVEETATLWQRLRLRLVSNLSRIREICRDRTEEGADQLALESESMKANLEAFLDLVTSLAPNEVDDLAALSDRADLLLDNLQRDYAQGTETEVAATLRLLEQALGRAEELAARSDRELGRSAIPGFVQPPPDWQSSEHEEPAMRIGLVLMDAKQLADGIEGRREELRDSTRARLGDGDALVAREVGEMARALVERQGELPSASRPGFVAAALRLEVIAENLGDLHTEGDRLRFRRQLIELQEAVEDVQAFIAVRDRLRRESERP